MVNGPFAGSGPSGPGPGQQLAAHPIQLADVAPPEAAQEGAQGGWRLDRAAQGAGRPPGAQHIGVVNTVAPSQRRRHQRHHLVARVRPPRGIAQVEALPDEFGQAEVPCQGGRKEQPGIGHQAAVVEGDLDLVGVVAWQHLLGAPFPGSVFCYKTIIPEAQEHLLAASGTLTRRPPSVDSGLGRLRTQWYGMARCVRRWPPEVSASRPRKPLPSRCALSRCESRYLRQDPEPLGRGHCRKAQAGPPRRYDSPRRQYHTAVFQVLPGAHKGRSGHPVGPPRPTSSGNATTSWKTASIRWRGNSRS